MTANAARAISLSTTVVGVQSLDYVSRCHLHLETAGSLSKLVLHPTIGCGPAGWFCVIEFSSQPRECDLQDLAARGSAGIHPLWRVRLQAHNRIDFVLFKWLRPHVADGCFLRLP